MGTVLRAAFLGPRAATEYVLCGGPAMEIETSENRGQLLHPSPAEPQRDPKRPRVYRSRQLCVHILPMGCLTYTFLHEARIKNALTARRQTKEIDVDVRCPSTSSRPILAIMGSYRGRSPHYAMMGKYNDSGFQDWSLRAPCAMGQGTAVRS